MARNGETQVTGWVGWIYFAGFMMMLTGIFEAIAGLTALLNNNFYAVAANRLVVFDFTTWGWLHLLVGVVIMMAGMAVLSGHVWARIVGVMLAMLSIIANFAFITAYPIWSIVVIVADALIIYALTVHGSEARD
jgi:hypothetical protein